jgi:hypothetical protein
MHPGSFICQKHRFLAKMIFPSPTTRCARHLPHNNMQGSDPAVIPVEQLVQAKSFPASGHTFVPEK